MKAIIEPKLGYKIEYFNSDSTDPIQILKQVNLNELIKNIITLNP
jgi:hypothetical protein